MDSYPHELKTIVADAGYGSEENLLTLDELGVDYLIKYGLFDKEQKRSYHHSDKNLKNWSYDAKTDTYTHPDGWSYHFTKKQVRKTETGFKQEITIYQSEEPELAPQKCLYINKRYLELKEKKDNRFYLMKAVTSLRNARLMWNLFLVR